MINNGGDGNNDKANQIAAMFVRKRGRVSRSANFPNASGRVTPARTRKTSSDENHDKPKRSRSRSINTQTDESHFHP